MAALDQQRHQRGRHSLVAALDRRHHESPSFPTHCRPADRSDGYAIQAAVAGTLRSAGRRLEDRRHEPGRPGAHRRRRPTRGTAARATASRPSPGPTVRQRDVSLAGNTCASPKPSSRSVCGRVAAGARARLRPAGSARRRRHAAPGDRDSRLALRRLRARRRAAAHRRQRLRLLAGRRRGRHLPTGDRQDLAAHSVETFLNGRPAETGIGANVLRDPRLALTWLANELRTYGQGLHGRRSGHDRHVHHAGCSIAPGRSRFALDFGESWARSMAAGTSVAPTTCASLPI